MRSLPLGRIFFVVILLASLTMSSHALELEDLADYYDNMPDATQNFTPYPAQPALPVQTPPEKKSWFKRLFSPATQQMSPPIYQVPKISAGSGKETKAVTYPLVRLAKGVVFDGQRLEPGMYLLSLQAGSQPALRLMRQNQTLLSIPVQADAPLQSEPNTSAALPKPPESLGPKATQTEPTGFAELSEDGVSLRLVYQQGDKRYTSIPITVRDSWRP